MHSHGPDEWELHAFLGGEGRFLNGSARHVIDHGDLHITPPGTLHAVQPADGGGALTYYAVLFALSGPGDATGASAASIGSPALRTEISPHSPRPLECELMAPATLAAFPHRIDARARLLLEDLVTRFAHPDGRRQHAASHQLAAWLWELTWRSERSGSKSAPVRSRGARTPAAAGTSDSVATEPARASTGSVHVRRARAIIDGARTHDISIAEVSARLGVTQEHLTRTFAQEIGVPPLAYHRRVRIDYAASALINSSRSVKEIAWEAGYRSATQFARSFRAVAGMSPSEFRARYLEAAPTDYAIRIVGEG